MSEFSFNEDGTLSYHQGHVPYDTTKQDYGQLSYEAPKGNGKHRKKAKISFDDLSTGEAINAFIHSFREDGLLINKKVVAKYLPNVAECYKEYFLRKVEEHNEYINRLWGKR